MLVLATLASLVFAAAGVVLFVWILWLLWKRSEQKAEAPAIEIGAAEPTPAPEAPAAEAEVEEEVEAEEPVADVEAETKVEEEAPEEPPAPDDLKRIEGIGPKFSSVLQEAGIATYTQLAEVEVGQIEEILKAADPRLLRLADPTTWPEQAALAAAGEWEALAALQGQLKRGRRV